MRVVVTGGGGKSGSCTVAELRSRGHEVTVLDLPVVGRDRDDTWRRVERHRGRAAAAAYAARTHAGTIADHRDRYAGLAAEGVSTVFLATRDLDGPDDMLDLAGLTA